MKAIRTKYHGPTNTRGSRITASDEDGNKCTIPYPHELSGEACHRLAADALCSKMKWDGSSLIGGGLKNGYVFVFGPGVRSDGSKGREVGPDVGQLAFSGDDMEKAEAIARKLGYEQTAYTSSSSMWGLFCLPENPATWKGNRRALCGGCIIKTPQLGFLFVQDLEDLGLSELV